MRVDYLSRLRLRISEILRVEGRHQKMGVNVGIVCAVLLLLTIQAMGVLGAAQLEQFSENLFKRALPIDTTFRLPAAPTAWPPGEGFASGIIDLGGLQVSQVSTFNRVWSTVEGGPDDEGATVCEPAGIPQGFSMLGSYIQPNNKPLFGWVLVAKDVSLSTSNGTLKQPVDYTLVWSSASMTVNQDSPCYVWLPKAPDGYKALGHVVTTTLDKPSLDKIRCVRSDLTDQCEAYSWIWGSGNFNFYDVRPSNRGTQAPGVRVGTFVAQNGGTDTPLSIACLKNTNAISKYMPNLEQIEALFEVYSPILYLHPDDEYLPSSVNWFFSNGALLYKKGQESNPVPVAYNGTNLPQDPNNDGAYWLDLPADEANKERVKKGDLPSAHAYAHVKPMFGGTFTDIAMWVFYPFNGAGRAKVEFITIDLGKIGEHVGDWEHMTLRVSNLDGLLWQVYFSQHSKGAWVDSSQLEFKIDYSTDFPTNKPVVYSSLHGHASYPHAGLYLQGKKGIGIRNDAAKSDKFIDMERSFLVSAEYLGSEVIDTPPWLNFFREWGPKIDYDIDDELKKVEKVLPGKLKDVFENIVRSLPKEVLGEEGPTGPKVKNSWNGDEV